MGDVALNPEFWTGRSVFITGHTGFKGGWLATWLLAMGARVSGYALPPDTEPSYFDLCGLAQRMASSHGDVCDAASLRTAMAQDRPEVIFHLAAQSLVRRAYREPLRTFATNVMGTANLLEVVRDMDSVRAVIIVTSDKCYDLTGPDRPMREGDPLGGEDPYSASKACAELVSAAYRRSFFNFKTPLAIATARAGNVIGGGDWAEDRLVPDAVRALHEFSPLIVRNPRSVRPWQHVLEPLSGYLMLAERLYFEGKRWGEAWNFGPRQDDTVEVANLADKLVQYWGTGTWKAAPLTDALHESRVLRLDSSKATRVLRWRPRFNLDQAVKMTVEWYRKVLADPGSKPYDISCSQIARYVEA
jgi:CDP-glucose 4,6-dehydratase